MLEGQIMGDDGPKVLVFPDDRKVHDLGGESVPADFLADGHDA